MSQQRSPNDDLVIGVDGGGTKTVAWVAPLDDSTNNIVLGRGQTGPSNPRAVGFEVAQFAIGYAVAEALAEANRPREKVAAAWFGVAGAGRESEQTLLESWARKKGAIAHRVRVSGDAEPILSAAASDHCGIAVISGTGSLAWGRNSQGEIARTGGCGYLIGDEGSAYAIAVHALRMSMQSADGRRPPTALLDRLLSHFDAASPANLIEILYSPEMTRDQIASAAQLVFALSEDPTAAAIIATAAGDLAIMITTLARQLRFEPHSYPLAMTGGLLVHQDSFRPAVTDRLTDIRPSRITVVTDPVRGAVALARRLAQSKA